MAQTSTFTYRYDRWWDDAGYSATLGAPFSSFAAIALRAPSEAESWHNFFGGNAYVYFTIESRDGLPHAVPAGTPMRIWCPFVLDPALHYSLTIAGADAPIGPIPATFSDNAFAFLLPAFVMSGSARLMGEVDGDP